MTGAKRSLNRWLGGIVGLVTAALPMGVLAYQPDAPFVQYHERNKAVWATQDKTIDQKLAALEKNYQNKQPEQIRSTAFKVIVRGGSYDFVVVEQKLR